MTALGFASLELGPPLCRMPEMVNSLSSKFSLSDAHSSANRLLICIPIIHSDVDMGSLREAVQQHKLQLLGRETIDATAQSVERMWAQIRGLFESAGLDHKKLRIYQDGLPDCGRETEIIREFAGAGSLNYQLLAGLIEKGAAVMGTESPDLLVQEYQLIRQSFPRSRGKAGGSFEREKTVLSRSLLKRRDQYIADRINGTLLEGEVGVVFIGMLHSFQHYLAPDIRVLYPIRRPGWPSRRN